MGELDLPPHVVHAVYAVSIAVGLVVCFLGYRIFRVVLGFVGFMVGSGLVGPIAYRASDGSTVVTVIAGIVGGIIGAVTCTVLYYVGIFALGAVLGAMLVGGASLGARTGMMTVLIVGTAVIGAANVVAGAVYFARGMPLEELAGDPGALGPLLYVVLAVWVALSVAGIFVQYGYTGRRRSES